MSSTSAPFGFRASYHNSGQIRPKAYTIASTYAANIFSGDPVKLTDAGVVQLGTSDGTRSGTTDGIKIDPSLARTGKAATIFDDFEQKTGMSRDDFLDALNKGKTPAEIMAGNKKFGPPGAAQNALNAASTSGNIPTSAEALAATVASVSPCRVRRSEWPTIT